MRAERCMPRFQPQDSKSLAILQKGLFSGDPRVPGPACTIVDGGSSLARGAVGFVAWSAWKVSISVCLWLSMPE